MRTLREWLSSSPLARVSEKIAQAALPSIRLTAHPAEEIRLRLGSTKFGGLPDLPFKMSWPECNGSTLPFVAQINLAEIAPYDVNHLFPDTGILSFFFDQEAFFESQHHDRTKPWQVLYISGPSSGLQRLPIPENITKQGRYGPCEVTYAIEITLPDYSHYDATSLERLNLPDPLTYEEEQAYYQIQAQLAGSADAPYHLPRHRLLGHPDDVQWDMYKELGGVATSWQLLFQVDSDGVPDTDWGDTGRIYYWIRTCNLAERDFSQVQLILQST